jgi:ADP-ribose pyrophosphatase YjhB (NUDIX family)
MKMDYIHDLRKIIGPRKIILNCAGALIIRDNKILFQRRTDNGQWGLIGGLLEMNETYEQAALREIREETGLEVTLDSFLGIFHNHHMVWSNGDAAHVLSAMFTAHIVSGEPRVDEESYELRFFGKDELPALFAEDHIAALDAYFRGVRYPLLQENAFIAQDEKCIRK